MGASGARYEGEVLAGRPHGRGQYVVRKAGPNTDWLLQYEGDWVQGRREGQGTRYYAATNEVRRALSDGGRPARRRAGRHDRA